MNSPAAKSPRRAGAIVGAIIAALGAGGCSTTGEPQAVTPEAPVPVIAAGTGAGIALTRTALSAPEESQARTAAAALLARLIAEHPQLAGTTAAAPVPVYEQTAPAPVGAMVELALPTPLASIDLDLIRIKADKPDPVPSRITNLDALELIYLFRSGEIVYLGVEPGAREAQSPDKATTVEALDPERAADADYGDSD